MKPSISVITLATENLDRALSFYRDGMGLPTEGIIGQEYEHGEVVFIDLQPGLKLALWPRASLAHDTGLALAASGFPASMLAHNVSSLGEVDSVMQQAAAAGATIVKPPCDTFWGGYAGYFRDPDGHLWEVVWNPELLPAQ